MIQGLRDDQHHFNCTLSLFAYHFVDKAVENIYHNRPGQRNLWRVCKTQYAKFSTRFLNVGMMNRISCSDKQVTYEEKGTLKFDVYVSISLLLSGP
jgi:hypothetical protein